MRLYDLLQAHPKMRLYRQNLWRAVTCQSPKRSCVARSPRRIGCARQRRVLPRLAVHDFVLTILGVHLLDRADFDALAEAAATRRRWEFMLTMAPLPIPNGTGSPLNPIAIF